MTIRAVIPEPALETLLDDWAEALLSRDPARLVALYAEDAVLLPTISSRIRRSHAEIADYFRTFLLGGPVCRLVEGALRRMGEVAVHDGLYRFTLTAFDGSPEMEARFTFVYQRIGQEWKIVSHHSSHLPEG